MRRRGADERPIIIPECKNDLPPPPWRRGGRAWWLVLRPMTQPPLLWRSSRRLTSRPPAGPSPPAVPPASPRGVGRQKHRRILARKPSDSRRRDDTAHSWPGARAFFEASTMAAAGFCCFFTKFSTRIPAEARPRSCLHKTGERARRPGGSAGAPGERAGREGEQKGWGARLEGGRDEEIEDRERGEVIDETDLCRVGRGTAGVRRAIRRACGDGQWGWRGGGTRGRRARRRLRRRGRRRRGAGWRRSPRRRRAPQ